MNTFEKRQTKSQSYCVSGFFFQCFCEREKNNEWKQTKNKRKMSLTVQQSCRSLSVLCALTWCGENVGGELHEAEEFFTQTFVSFDDQQ